MIGRGGLSREITRNPVIPSLHCISHLLFREKNRDHVSLTHLMQMHTHRTDASGRFFLLLSLFFFPKRMPF